jgi:hypothetical protein
MNNSMEITNDSMNYAAVCLWDNYRSRHEYLRVQYQYDLIFVLICKPEVKA